MEDVPEARDSRARDRPRDRDHRPERHRDRDHRDHRPERQRDRDRGPERQRDRVPGPEGQRDRDRRRDRNGDRPRDRDRRGDRDPDRRGDRDRDRRENRDWDRRGDRDGDRRSERDYRLDRQDWEHPRSNGQRGREKSRQSRTQDVPWEPSADRAPPPWSAPGEMRDPWAQRNAGFGRPESDYPSRRSQPFSPRPGLEEVEYYESEAAGLLECHKCRYLCTGRACCQLMKVLLNLLILACSSVSYNSIGGYTGITSLGGIYYYQYGGAFSGFDGPDGEKAQRLDIQFYQLTLPTVTAAMAVGGGLMAFSCLLILLGVLRVPWHCPLWLVIEALLDTLISIGYIPALYFYFHHLSAAYSSPLCKERETLYQSKGYSGFTCSFHGGDIGAGLFAAIGVIVFAVGAVLAFRAYRRIRKPEGKPTVTYEL
ncbi:MARVEL domain-containing protein 3 isoform X2 [Antechinus flavipes]|uniref:MARVEL domain-containing protein 3 isoform X2 n=1 Tax=Antechinus flavipes TaxID=38775 RepID=UPI0022357133|nr:MARVEL domain-containing protein 3 isoform X2 [Antechinus flavipes]